MCQLAPALTEAEADAEADAEAVTSVDAIGLSVACAL